MATLRIYRSSEYTNRYRKIQLYLNGRKLDSIANGEAKAFTIAPGKHKLKSKLDWCSSPEIEFEVTENEAKTIELGSFAGRKLIRAGHLITVPILLLLFRAGKYFETHPTLGYLAACLTIPSVLYLAYMLSFGRNKYLQLTVK